MYIPSSSYLTLSLCYLFFSQDGQAALHHASKSGHTNVVKLLVDKGAQVNTKDNVSTNQSCCFIVMVLSPSHLPPTLSLQLLSPSQWWIQEILFGGVDVVKKNNGVCHANLIEVTLTPIPIASVLRTCTHTDLLRCPQSYCWENISKKKLTLATNSKLIQFSLPYAL